MGRKIKPVPIGVHSPGLNLKLYGLAVALQ